MRRILVLALIAASLIPGRAMAADVHLTGSLAGAPYEIRVPADWNGTLVVFAHGYRDKADHPGEVDDRSVTAFWSDPVEEQMLQHGYAIAGSAYRDNGWAVDEGIEDTNRLVEHFRTVVGVPRRTLLTGFSMGSLVAFHNAEHYGGLYDGFMPSCAVGAGAPRSWDGAAAVLALYSTVFGLPATWGTPGDLRDDLDFETEVLPRMYAQLTEPGGFARFEFIRLVIGIPRGPEWPFAVMFFSTEGRAELERRAGGPVAQNLDHTYRLSTADRAYLAALGLTGVDDWLASVPRFDASKRQYVERFADYSGRIKAPVLTLDTTTDALVPASHINAYDQTTAARSDLVANAWTNGVGHCAFTPQQLITAVGALDGWVATGVKPSSFPAEQGFVGFEPPPWPQ